MPSPSRDFIRFLPNQRVDLPDFNALQRNNRSEPRYGFHHLLHARDVTSNVNAKRIFTGFDVSEDGGGPSSIIEITRGVATGIEVLPDGGSDRGIIFGSEESTAVKQLDFSGRPVGTYTVWLRFSQDPGQISARVFWNDTTEQEDVDSIETRLLTIWDVVAEIAAPSIEWQAVADVAWNGATIVNADITPKRVFFFEGAEVTGFPHEWGDGANDRDADRAQYGIKDLHTFVRAMQRQISELAGDGQPWWEDWAYIKQDEFRINAVTDFWTATQFKVGNTVTSNTDIEGVTIDLLADTLISLFVANGTLTMDGASGATLASLAGSTTITASADVFVTSGAATEISPLGGDLRMMPTGTIRAMSFLRAEDTFEVQGGQLSGDNVSFAATIEDMRSIAAGSFAVDPDDVAMANMADAGGTAFLSADAAGDVVRARADLGSLIPNGAILNNVVVEGTHVDGSAALTAVVYKVDDTGVRTVLAGPTTAPSGAGAKTITFAAIAETIAHQSFSYILKVTLDNGGGIVDGTQLKRAKVSWQQDELYPDPEVAS